MKMWILEHITEIVVLVALAVPCVWCAVANLTYEWRKHRRQERIQLSWDRLSRFFSENADRYPEAAVSFFRAKDMNLVFDEKKIAALIENNDIWDQMTDRK